jgi:hypothetical protein
MGRTCQHRSLFELVDPFILAACSPKMSASMNFINKLSQTFEMP